MPEQNEKDFLHCDKWRELFTSNLSARPWQIVYSSPVEAPDESMVYCALIPNNQTEKRVKDYQWDLQTGSGRPGFSESQTTEGVKRTYDRLGFLNGIEPLVHRRAFASGPDTYSELSEEFRFFHELYEGNKRGEFYKNNDAGDPELVVKITNAQVEMRTKEIRQFLAVKSMSLSVQVSVNRFSKKAVADFSFNPTDEVIIAKDHSFHWGVRPCDWRDDFETHAYFLGKKLLPPLPLEQCGIWPFNETDEKYPTFIIGADESGKNVEYTCDPEQLANYFGKNPQAPHYVTPVHFRADVLTKYHAHPKRFAVEDGLVRAEGLWSLRMDNDHTDRVVVFLGDLGRDLPSSERDYWRTFNIAPEGKTMSETAFKRSMLGQFTDPTRPDLVFKGLYPLLAEEWRKKFGWDLFLPLPDGDKHHFTALRIPVNNDQSQFDAQVQSLTKLIIDSLNEAKLAEGLTLQPDAKGITKLEAFLQSKNFSDADVLTSSLRDLQLLRSAGVAHRKGSNYKKAAAKFGLEERDLREVTSELFAIATRLIQNLGRHFVPHDSWQ